MSEPTWYGWAWHRGRWHRLCGPLSSIGEAARELARALGAGGWDVPARHQVLTSGPREPRRLNLTPESAAAPGGPAGPSGATGGP
jgi:hypothetical protein